ncbi:hypothetical protein Bca4012_011441 [Brassica carinata]
MKACFFCYKKKKKIVIFKFEVFDESIKQIAKEVAGEFPGVTKVVEVEGRGQLEVRGKFSISELTKELKKIDESVETIKIVPGGVTEPEVKIQQQDKGKRPFNIQKASEPLNYGASSSNWTGSKKNRLWEKAKGVRAGAAEEAKVIGAAEIWAKAPQRWKEEEMKQEKIRQEKEKEKRRKQALAEEEMKQKNIRQEKEKEKRRQQALAEEEMKQKKIRQEKEKEKRRQQALAEEEMKQKKVRQEKEKEKRRKQALENNSGGTTQGSMVTGITRSLWSGISTLTIASAQALGTGQPSTSAQTQRTGQPRTSTTQTQRTGQTSISRQTQRTGQPSTSTTQTQRTGQTSISRQTQRTGQPSTLTQYPFSTQTRNTTR